MGASKRDACFLLLFLEGQQWIHRGPFLVAKFFRSTPGYLFCHPRGQHWMVLGRALAFDIGRWDACAFRKEDSYPMGEVTH